jgi:secreted trypsin-like serine protease
MRNISGIHLRGALVLSLMLAASGCGLGLDSLQRKSSDSQVSIANGDPVGRGDPVSLSSVALVSAIPGDLRGYMPYCSGTLIESDLVVTAAHCIDTSAGRGTQQVFVRMNDLSVTGTANGALQAVVVPGVAKPHEFFGRLTTPEFAYDLALVRLTQPAPSFMRPVKISDPAQVTIGQRVILAGYGLVVPKGSQTPLRNSGVLHKVSTQIADVYPLEPSTERSFDPVKGQLYGLIEFSSPDRRSGGCQGDSGGPMFVEGASGLELIGSTVGGPGICASSGFYTNLTLFKSWIEQTKETL